MPPGVTPNPLRILCVDDEPAIRDILALALRNAGYHADVAHDGLQAWQTLAQTTDPYDVVITDNEMPHLTGLQLAEKLRASGYPGAIVFFSSTLRPENLDQLAALQVEALIEKGRPLAELLAVVRRIRPPAQR